MAELEIKNIAGKKAGSYTLGKTIAEADASDAVIHRTVVAEEANKRQGTQSAKTRSEVRGGGRKPYKQKKTGNARQGTIRAPHYAHGGMALAVKPRSYEKKVNRKERRAAIVSSLAAKISDGAVTIVDKITFAEPKTKSAVDMLAALSLQGERRILVILPEYDESTYKCFRNLPNVTVRTAPSSFSTKAAEAPVEEKATKGKKKAEPVKAAAPKGAAFSARDLVIARKIVVVESAMKKIEEVWSK